MLGVADSEKTLLCNWNDTNNIIHKLELSAEKIWWDEEGEQMALATETKFVMYNFNKKNKNLTEVLSITDKVTSGVFVDKIFYYINKAGKIHFAFNGK